MPLLFVLIPLTGIILLNLLYGIVGRKTAFWTAAAVLLLQIVMSLTLGAFLWSSLVSNLKVDFITELKIGSYSALMLFTIGIVAFVALFVGKYSNDSEDFNFSNLILLIIMGMNGVVMVNDLFSLYIFLEITAVCSFILIAMYKNREALEGAFKYVVMSTVATVFMLSAIVLIFMAAGSLKFDDVAGYISGLGSSPPLPVLAALVLFMTGLSIKAGLVPFHGWLPDAYSSAPSAVSVLMAGIVTKIAGVYTLLTVFDRVFGRNAAAGSILMIFGAVSIVVGALAALDQDDFKRMLAYSSISQVGYIVLGIGAGTPLAFLGAVLHLFNHATFKSLLFVNSAAVEMQTGTRKLNVLGGLASRMPVTGGTSIIGFLSTAGIPPLSGFWSKFIIILALWQAGAYSYAVIALLASILTLAYFLKLQRRVFFGNIAEGLEKVKEAGKGISSISIILSAIIVLVGLLFPLVLVFLQANGLL